jgi:FkbM family methyltransferase
MSHRHVTRKAIKLAGILRRSSLRRALAEHRVAATTEHLGAIRACAPGTVLDIGANKGQFSLAVRSLFPKADIHAFEPLPAAADTFARVFDGDPHIHLHRVAVGAHRSRVPFYVTDREDSSSLLRPGRGQEAAFGVVQASVIEVDVAPLDEEIDLASMSKPVLMKIDVQGAELEVLRGITDLDAIDFIYVEVSFVELYENQALFDDVRQYLDTRGFALQRIFHRENTKEFGLTQADCLFAHHGTIST